MFTNPAEYESRKYIFSRDDAGRVDMIERRWWHGLAPKLFAIIMCYLLASNWLYREQLADAETRVSAAEERTQRAEAWKRIEPVIFLLEAGNLAEFEGKTRRVQTSLSEQRIHSQAARTK